MSTSINLWHSDLWKITFSNIPTVTKPEDLYLFENFAKTVQFPEYGMDIDETEHFIGYRIQTPIAHSLNRDLVLLMVEFKIVENFKNYLYLFQWLWNLKYGQNIDTARVRDYTVKEISVILLDNMKRIIGRFRFTNCLIVNVTALPFTYGTGDEVTFMANFAYNQILWEPEDIPQCDK